MKKILLPVVLVLLSAITAIAQAPQLLNYQGVARSISGTPLPGQTIGLQFIIHDASASGVVLYQETNTATTNSFGLYTVSIGSGTAVTGSFAGITWGSGPKYLEVQLDPMGGSSYTSVGTSELLSVPYAIYANKSHDAVNATTATSAGTLTGTVPMGGDVTGINTAASVVKLQGNSVSAAVPTAGQVLTWNNGTTSWTPATPSDGTVTSVTAGTGLLGGTITTSGTISMPGVGTAGTYGSTSQIPVFSTDAQGRVTGVTNTPLTAVTNVNTTAGQLTGGPITTTGTLGLANAGTAGTYGSSTQVPVFTTDAFGRVTSVTNTTIPVGTGTVTSVSTAPGQLTGGPITTAGTLGLATAGTSGTYGSSTQVPVFTTDAYGRVTSVTNTTITAGAGTVTSVTAGTGLSGGTITTTGTVSMPNVGTAGTYGSSTVVPVITTDAQGRITAITPTAIAAGGTGTVTTVNTSAPLSGGPITSSGTISMTTSGVTAATYGSSTQTPTIAVDAWGRITGASNTTISGTVPGGSAGGDLTGTYPNPTLTTSGVAASTYGSATQVPVIAVDAKGRITSASNTTISGVAPGGSAGGDLAGTYPNPAVAAGAITNAKVAAGAAIAYSKLALTGSIAVADHSATGAPSGTTFLRGDNTWSTPTGIVPGGAAGGDLAGTYPNPTVAAGAITNAKVAAGAAIAYSKLALTGSIAVADHSATGVPSATNFLRGDNTWSTPTGIVPGGAAGGDLTGTYPNPTLGTSGVIAGSYGTATQVPTISIDAKGRVTSAVNTTITVPTVSGTTNWIPKFTGATSIGNSAMSQFGSRLCIAPGGPTNTAGLYINTSDSFNLRINQASNANLFGGIRYEYNGGTDVAGRVGLLATSIRTIADVNGTGIEGAGSQIGVYGYAQSSAGSQVEGLEGDSYASGTYSIAVAGFADRNGATAPTNCWGIYGYAQNGTSNYAAYLDGNVKIIGSISKGSGTFMIDHPLDPDNKYLYHSFVESPDMMNIYNGNATTDASGTAVVTLPDYFEALNKDFRYQLTVIGTFAQAIVGEKVHDNKFVIKTSVPNVEVSWQVTGVRQDPYANAHRVVPEVEKEPYNKGKYLYAKELGKPDNLKINGDVKRQRQSENVLPMKNNSEQNRKAAGGDE